MFRGATLVNLDSKGRLAVPTRYRDGLIEDASGQLVCTIDIHHPCLLLYPLPEWEIIEQKIIAFIEHEPHRAARTAFAFGTCQRMSDG